jgi:cell division protein FtsW
MVYSASIAMPDNPKFARYAHTHFLVRHTLSLVMAFVAPCWPFRCRWHLGKGGAVAVRGVAGAAGGGADPARGQGRQRRAPLDRLGVMNFQPSELAKLAVLLYAADYMVRKMDVKERFFRAVLPMAPPWLWSACCCWPSPTWAPSW